MYLSGTRRAGKKIYIVFIILLVCIPISYANDLAVISSLRLWPAPQSTRIVLDLSAPVKYKLSTLTNPERVVLDISNATLAFNLTPENTHQGWVDNIRAGVHPGNTIRLVFEVARKLKSTAFLLEPNETYKHRLVLDLETDEREEILSLFELELPKPKLISEFIVVLDAGHGGEDPGAIGKKGTQEKHIALMVAKIVADKLNQEEGVKAYLTREGDYFLRLRNRIQRARAFSADLFVSIHADAFKDPTANGASAFVLSSQGASSESALWLANSENRADLIGGVKLDDKSNLLVSVLLDLSQTASSRSSLDAADYILNSMGSITKLRKNQVEQAGFAVLKSPDIPSVLVELGFISNPQTELKLRDVKYQKHLANSISAGIMKYKKINYHKF